MNVSKYSRSLIEIHLPLHISVSVTTDGICGRSASSGRAVSMFQVKVKKSDVSKISNSAHVDRHFNNNNNNNNSLLLYYIPDTSFFGPTFLLTQGCHSGKLFAIIYVYYLQTFYIVKPFTSNFA